MTDSFYTPPVANEPEPGQQAPLAPLLVPEAEPDRVARESVYYPASQGLALREVFEDAQITDRLLGFIGADTRRAFDADRRRMFGEQAPALLSAEAANERYGIEGRLRFDEPVDRNIAAWRQSQAQRSAFREETVANADLAWWQTLGTSFAGSLLDPVGIPLWLFPELAVGRALRAGSAGTALGRLPGAARGAITGAAEGMAGGVLYEGANLWLHHEASDDYDLGQASANVLLGGLLGAGIGSVGGWWESRGAAPRAPAAIEALDEPAQLGAFVEAMDAMIEDRPVDLGPVLARAEADRTAGRISPETARALDETGGQPAAGGGAENAIEARRLDEATAVTPRGDELAVRYALVEAEDLITSHDDDLYPSPDYPAELQPRRRDRAGAQARNRLLEAELNPKRLMRDVGAETGAPIIASDGTVESGNGRTIAIRRSYRTGSAASARYRAELEAQGFDVSGMKAPVLVRERVGRMTGEERVKLTRDMNMEATEAYSPSERAAADAQAIDDSLLGMIEGADLNAAANRTFVRGFLDRVASDDLNRMTTADGRLSDAGLDRMNAALVAKAYGDRQLVEALFEATDSNIKAIGNALAEAAPEWAAMRAAMARGEVPAELDPTEALKAAVAFVRAVRARRGNVGEAMDLIIDQIDAFNGAAMTPETEAFVRAFFRSDKDGATLWKSPRGAASLAEGLRWLASETRKVQPGPNLFGEVADASTGRDLLDGLTRWFGKQGEDGNPLADLFAPEPAGGNVRPAVVEAGREPGGQGAGGEAAPGVAREIVGDLPKRGVAPAFLGEDGRIYAGKIGSNHMSAASAELRAVGVADVGFVTSDGEFLNRVQALEYVNSRGEGIKPSASMEGELDALDYRDQSKFAREDANAPAKPKVPKGQTPPPPKGDPFADPEVAQLAADTQAMMLREGLEAATDGATDPQTVADAVAAGAACLKGG